MINLAKAEIIFVIWLILDYLLICAITNDWS